MKRDGRLSIALHMLLHMDELAKDAAITSEKLGPMMKTNPVVIRRTMAGLREAGLVTSTKGHGGGWALAKRLDAITLADVYEALGIDALFTIGSARSANEKPSCLLEQAVNRTIEGTLEEAERIVLAKLRSVTVAELVSSADRKAIAEHSRHHQHHHGKDSDHV